MTNGKLGKFSFLFELLLTVSVTEPCNLVDRFLLVSHFLLSKKARSIGFGTYYSADCVAWEEASCKLTACHYCILRVAVHLASLIEVHIRPANHRSYLEDTSINLVIKQRLGIADVIKVIKVGKESVGLHYLLLVES